jgi:predicted nucleic-acid-binding protein
VIGLDTNVLVRYLTQDDPVQARKAGRAIERALSAGSRVHVDTVVLCELVWVLKGVYRFDRATICTALERLLETAQVSVADRDIVREAVSSYRRGPGDFADHVIALRNAAAGCTSTATFDSALRGSKLLALL